MVYQEEGKSNLTWTEPALRVDGAMTGRNWNCWYVKDAINMRGFLKGTMAQGKGGFGSVVKARNKIDERTYAGVFIVSFIQIF